MDRHQAEMGPSCLRRTESSPAALWRHLEAGYSSVQQVGHATLLSVYYLIWRIDLPTTLMVQVEPSVRCVCLSVCQDSNLWTKWPLI